MADQKEESWFSVGLSDGKQDDRGLAYRTALMFSDGYISFCYFNILHSSIFYGFYHFLTTLEVDPTTIALWCVVVALVPLLFEIRPLLHKTDAFSHFIPFFALLFHGLSAIPHPRARSVLSIVAGAFALAHFITRVSRPPNDPVAQRTYGAYALGLLGQVIVRIGALSMAPALYMVIPIACAGLLAAAVLWREARIESRASKARVEAGETMVPLRASSIASKGSFMFIPTGAALAFWLIMMLSLVTWPGVALRLGGVDVYPTVLLPLFALGAGIFLPMLLRNHAFAKKIVRARNAGTAVASTGALFAVLGALLIYRNDSPTWMILGSMGVCFGTGPLLFSILHELVRLGTLQAAGRTMAFGLLIFIFWLPYYAGYTYGGYEYQSAGIYHRHLRNTLTTAMAEDDIPGFGLAVLLPIALCAAMTILIEIVRADHPGRGVQIRRVVQRLPMLRTAREMTSTLVIVLLLVFLPSVLVNAFLSPVHEKRIIDGQLTVMSVNVHQGYQLAGGDGYEGHHNVARLYDAIIKHDPDIVAIQGSNGLPFISGAIDIPHYLSRAAGMYAYTNNTLDDTLGVAFLTRRPLNNVSFWADAADARRAIGAATLLVSEVPVRLYVGGPQLRQFVTTQTPIRNDIAAGHPVLAFFDVSDEPRENEAELRAALGYNETTAGVTTPGDLGLLLASNTSWPARVARSAVHWRQVSTADYDTAIGSTTPASTAPSSSSGAQDLLRCNSFGSIANSGDGFSATGSIAIASTADNKLVATFSDITVKQGSDVAVGTFMGHAHVASCADGGGAHWQVDENGPADATNELWLPMTNLTASNQPYSTTSPAVSGDGDVNGIKSFVIHQMSTDEHDHDGHHHDDKRVCCDLTPVNSAAQTTENNAVGSMPYTVSKLSLVGVDSLPYEEFETDGVPPGGYQELAASLWIIGCFVLVVLVVAFIYSRNALGLDGSFGSWDEPEVQSSNNQINNANNNTTELKQIENDDDDEVDPDVVGAEKREKKSSKSNEKKSNKSTTETPKKVEKAKPSEEEEEEYEYEYEYETETVEPSTDDAKPVEKTTKTAAKDQSDTETGTEASYEYEYETETGQESEEVEYEYEYVTVSDDEVEKK